MAVEINLWTCLLPALAYALGSIPFGLLVARFLGGPDLRLTGSGNIGATNVRRPLASASLMITPIPLS